MLLSVSGAQAAVEPVHTIKILPVYSSDRLIKSQELFGRGVYRADQIFFFHLLYLKRTTKEACEIPYTSLTFWRWAVFKAYSPMIGLLSSLPVLPTFRSRYWDYQSEEIQ
jgi:hypothetical protein